MTTHAVEAHVQTIAERGTAVAGYAGSGTAFIFGLTTSEWQVIGVVGGLMFAALGFAFNAWLGWRRDQREANQREQP